MHLRAAATSWATGSKRLYRVRCRRDLDPGMHPMVHYAPEYGDRKTQVGDEMYRRHGSDPTTTAVTGPMSLSTLGLLRFS